MKIILVDAVYCFVIESHGQFKIFKEMQELLDSFPNRKILLTGASGEKFKEFGLDKMPYEVFTLKQNPSKSNPKYYKLMLEHFSLTKDNVIHFEHNLDAVKSAESAGIKTFYYDEYKKDLISLKAFLES